MDKKSGMESQSWIANFRCSQQGSGWKNWRRLKKFMFISNEWENSRFESLESEICGLCRNEKLFDAAVMLV